MKIQYNKLYLLNHLAVIFQTQKLNIQVNRILFRVWATQIKKLDSFKPLKIDDKDTKIMVIRLEYN